MKRWMKWAIVALVLLALATAVLGALSARKKQQQALAADTAAKAQTVVELAATDVVQAKTMELSQGLPVSGALKAVNSAFVKARVAGELQGLTVREGDSVKAGQVLARIDASEYQSRVRQAQEQADSAKAQAEVVQRQYDNNKALVDQGFISKTALDTSLANLNAARSTHKAALAAVDVAKKSLDDTVLRAPLTGQVAQRLAQPGERVGVDARVLEIVDLSRLELEASLGAADALSVRPGQTAVLQIEGSKQTVNATVARVNPSAQGGSRSVLVYLSVDNPGGQTGLRQGLFAQGTLGTTRVSALAVPLSAVRTDKPAPYVQVVENNQVAHKPVEPGMRASSANGDSAMVAVKGVAENAVVITGSVGALREGTAVKFTQPPAWAQTGAPAATAATPASSAKTAP